MSNFTPDLKAFSTAQAAFALRGFALHKSVRADDGRETFIVSQWAQTRTFSHWGDVTAFLTQIGG